MRRRSTIDHGQSARFRPSRFQEKKILADLAEMVPPAETEVEAAAVPANGSTPPAGP